MQLPLSEFAISSIANCCHRQNPLIRCEGAKADRNRELPPILARPRQLQPGTHRAAAWILEKAPRLTGTPPTATFRHKTFTPSSKQFLALATEAFFCLRIHQH